MTLTPEARELKVCALQQEKLPQKEACTLQQRVDTHSLQLEKAHA